LHLIQEVVNQCHGYYCWQQIQNQKEFIFAKQQRYHLTARNYSQEKAQINAILAMISELIWHNLVFGRIQHKSSQPMFTNDRVNHSYTPSIPQYNTFWQDKRIAKPEIQFSSQVAYEPIVLKTYSKMSIKNSNVHRYILH
jgi:hypothetical protein